MKKLSLTLIIILSVSQFLHAQFTTSGTVTSTTNTVGIGTTSPASSLSLGPSVSNKKLFIYDAGTEASGFGQANAEFRIFGISSAPNHISLGKYQLTNDNFTEQMRIDNAGNVGIGTTSPNTTLDVNGAISMQTFGNISSARGVANGFTNLFLGGAIKDNLNGTFTALGDGGSNYWAAIRMDNSGGNLGAINFYNGNSTGGSNYNISNANLASYLRMTITAGNVGIGTSDTKGYKLAVNGNVIATSMTVKLYANWPDYVFKKDYQLPSLTDVKTYIDQNQHLPDMPSEAEVAKNGLNLGEINKLLVKKMEEMTLYMIEAKEEINELKKQVQDLKKQIK